MSYGFWIDGSWCDEADATVSVLDHGLLYGDGVFEGIRAYGGRPFYLEPHLARLEASARALALVLPFERATLRAACSELAARLGDGYLRLVVTRGPGGLGLDPASCTTPRTILIGGPIGVTDARTRARGARLLTASVRRAPPDVLDGRIKSLNYLPAVLARLQARAAGADEALMLNHRGFVAEGTAENVLCVRGTVLETPPVTDGGLDGITRAVVLRLAAAEGLAVRERSLTVADLQTADEVLLTGTGAELVPVRELDGRCLAAPGPVTLRLADRFRAHSAALAAGTATEFPLDAPPGAR